MVKKLLLISFLALAGCESTGGQSEVVPKPEDFNRDGEYKPVEDMTQNEIREELEEIISDALTE